MKLNMQWKKVLYGIILIVIGIILAALHFVVAGDGIRDFISSIIAVISVLVILVGTYITLSEIINCKWTLDCLCIDLVSEAEKLPQVDILIANLLIEYIGYEWFKKVVTVTKPIYVSCIIQVLESRFPNGKKLVQFDFYKQTVT